MRGGTPQTLQRGKTMTHFREPHIVAQGPRPSLATESLQRRRLRKCYIRRTTVQGGPCNRGMNYVVTE